MRKLKLDELQRINIEEFKRKKKLPVIVVLDDIRSMHNVGSVFRTSDAFRIEKIYLCGITPIPPHREIQKTALGANDSVEWEYVENIQYLIELLKQESYQICLIEQCDKSKNLLDVELKQHEKYVLVFGNEVNGVHAELLSLADKVIEIPQFGTKHSFNISVSTGIVLWSFFEKIYQLGFRYE